MQLLSPMVKEMKILQPLYYFLFCIVTSLSLPAQTALLADFDFAEGGYSLLLMPKDDNLRDWTAEEEFQDTFPITYIDDVNALDLLKKSMVYEREEDDTLHYCNPHLTMMVCKGGAAVEIITFSRQCTAVFSANRRFAFHDHFDSKVYPLADIRMEVFPNLERARQILDSVKKSPDLIWFYEPAWTHFEGKFLFSQFNPELSQKDFASKLEAKMKELYPGETFELDVTEDQSDDIQLSDQPKGHFVIEVTGNQSLIAKMGNRHGELLPFQPFVLMLESYWKRK